jgi:hypothetical protein
VWFGFVFGWFGGLLYGGVVWCGVFVGVVWWGLLGGVGVGGWFWCVVCGVGWWVVCGVGWLVCVVV